VGTETLICGTSGVDVKAAVAVNVCVGVKVGGSGVNVNVGSCKVGDKVTDKTAWVNPAITVCAAEVLMAPGSCRSMVGKAQAKTTIDKVMIVKETRPGRNIAPPNKSQGKPRQKRPTSFEYWVGSSLLPFLYAF